MPCGTALERWYNDLVAVAVAEEAWGYPRLPTAKRHTKARVARRCRACGGASPAESSHANAGETESAESV